MQKNIEAGINEKTYAHVKIELSVFHYHGVSEIDFIYKNTELYKMVTFKFDAIGETAAIGDGANLGITQVIGDDENGIIAQEVERNGAQVAVVAAQNVTFHDAPQTQSSPEAAPNGQEAEVKEEQFYKPTDGLTM